MNEAEQITMREAYERLTSRVDRVHVSLNGEVFQTNSGGSGELHYSGRFTLESKRDEDLKPWMRRCILYFPAGSSYGFIADKHKWRFYEDGSKLEIRYDEIFGNDGELGQSVLSLREFG